jgi:hypothetical protein
MLKEMNPDAETTTLKTSFLQEIAACAEEEALDTMKKLLHSTTMLLLTILLSTITLIINMEASADIIYILLKNKLLSNVKPSVMQIQNVWHSNMA